MSVDSTAAAHESQGVPIRSIRVTVVSGPDAGRDCSASDVLSVGTAESNSLVLSDDTVSRFHLDLSRAGDRIIVEDNGSTNGTMIGDVRINRVEVRPGTTMKLGKTTLRIEDGETVRLELFDGEALGGLIGRSAIMRTLMARIERVANSDVSALLLGETGVGKEVVARTIHQRSARANGPFEIVDCGSMQPTLIGSELFGHEKGAFTGADSRHEGAFERAHGGTIFLDEIGELPASLQTALLGAIERRSFRRLGGKDRINFDARIICATHRDLRGEVNAGAFRQDLYYRIAVVMLRIPPLRERPDDIPLLVERFLRQSGVFDEVSSVFPDRVMETLKKHRWPGNVRELRNSVEAALVMGEDPVLDRVAGPGGPAEISGPSIPVSSLERLPFSEARSRINEEFEHLYLRALLERCEGNVTKAAAEAQLDRSYLSRLLKKRGIRIKRQAEPSE